MRNRFSYGILAAIALLSGFATQAQPDGGVESLMRSNDKIYVVLAVCITILLGFLLYLVRIDRKISRLEDQQ